MQTPDWTDALCGQVDPELFFPTVGGAVSQEVKIAKDICNDCHLIKECLAYALRHNYEGIWGGTTVTERQVMRRKLKVTVQAPISKKKL
jgi:hypothetical protein